jgi:deoxyribodipyrimidine photo-lyase
VAISKIDETRIAKHNDAAPGTGRYVLYWMQASVRSRQNHALEHAVQVANELGKPLVVGFGLDAEYAEVTPRTLRFAAEGVADVAGALERRNITFVVRAQPPLAVAEDLAQDAAAVVLDRNYLREPRRWRARLARSLSVPVVEVESNVVVPVEIASGKREWAARTIRPKLHAQLDRFLVELRTTAIEQRDRLGMESLDVGNVPALLAAAGIDSAEGPRYRGGEHQANATLRRFVEEQLSRYSKATTLVGGEASSHLSMYLHYGHISPVAIALAVRDAAAPREAVDAFLEELVVRRELAHNYVWFESDYDKYRALPDWARTTLDKHRNDDRESVYTAAQLEAGETADPYWNAAMVELRETGYLHNRMRMYWGKRILEWTNTPQHAFRVALELNNRYFFDGRDPSSYANVGWLFGLHDQAFQETEILGKVRPMTQSGLKRKIDADAYVELVEARTGSRVC